MLNIGIVQLEVYEGDISTNKNNIEKYVELYSSRNVDILCFPELCISGYDFISARTSLDEFDFFSELSKKYRQTILAGVVEHSREGIFDALAIWNKKGEIIGKYRKIHLWGEEKKFFDSGNEIVVINYNDWKIGLLICADLGFPELSRKLAVLGADLIFYPSAWASGSGYLFELTAATRAAENQVYSIALNRSSSEGKYCGRSSVFLPNGKPMKMIKHNLEDSMDVVLHKSKLKEIRNNELPWMKMRLPEKYKQWEE